MKIAILDIETTGLNPAFSRIIEIGIVILENFKIIADYSFLINPGCAIPSEITNLTGINSAMVRKSECFEVKAEEIAAITENHILCGHNVNFDYAFLKMEFQLCGISFNRKTLDTARLSKFLFPGKTSYSLKSLCTLFGINNSRPHRALPDARATAEILIKLNEYAGTKLLEAIIKKETLTKAPVVLKSKIIDSMPESTGVYYFMNKLNKPVYVGKAKNIKSRVQSHFRGEGNSFKIVAAANEIKDIRYELTGNELLASLLEDHEIRHHWPPLNNAQKSFNKRFGIVTYKDQLNRWRMAISSAGKAHCFFIYFHQYHRAVEFVLEKIKTFGLNGNYCAQPSEANVNDEDHNLAFEAMLYQIEKYNVIEIFLTNGRCNNEAGFIWIENGVYKGFGYTTDIQNPNPDQLRKSLQVRYSSITVEQTIKSLRRKSAPDYIFKENKKASTVEFTAEALFQT